MDNIPNKESVTGNLMKLVFTRIDYEDIIEVSANTLKEIKAKFPNSKILPRMLTKEDFNFRDYQNIIDLPEEIIKNSKCSAIYFEEMDMIVEVNQYFLRTICKVNKEVYKNYEESILENTMLIFRILDNNEDVKIKRISVNKINEVLCSSATKLKKIFKGNILRMDLFDNIIKWNQISSKAKNFVAFDYNDCNVNFLSLLENVEAGKRYIRLLLDYEVYIYGDRSWNDKFNNENSIKQKYIEEKLKALNDITYTLFIKSFTPKGLEMIRNNERIDEYEAY